MNRVFQLLAAAVVMMGCSCIASAQNADSLAFVNADWHWQDLGRKAEAGYTQIRLFDSMQSISVVRYPARKYHTGLLDAEGRAAANATDSLAIKADAKFALNGSYFDTRTLEHATFFSQKKEVLGETAEEELFRCNGVLAISRKNGKKLDIQYYEPEKEEDYRTRYYTVLAAGPVIMKDFRVGDFDPEESFNKTRHPRSFVGLTPDGYVYIVVVDGRFPGQADGASISELAKMARWFGMSDALNFDGGGSSAVWTESTGIINHPCDNRRFDHLGARKVPNILVVR